MEKLGRNWVRLAVFVTGVLVILGIAAGITLVFAAQVRNAQPTGVHVDLTSLERTVVGIYLNLHRSDIEGPAGTDSTAVAFSIKAGETAALVSTRLEKLGLIGNAELFRLLLRYWGVDSQIQAGDYLLKRTMPMSEIANQLQHGRLRTRMVTLREGLRAEEVAHLLANEGLVDQEEFIHLVRDDTFHYDFLRDRPSSAPQTLEGFLFPDTYQFAANITTTAVIDLMLKNFDRRITLEMRKRALDQDLTLYQALILASIVEREAVKPEERPIIASVYLNRLRKGMYLEADPTVQYAKGYDARTSTWWPVIAAADYHSVDSSFNTYANGGLPPAPICSPGLASVEAVLSAANTNYLFFVAKGDGYHAFADSFEEHLENQSKYR